MNYFEKHIGDYIRDTVSLTMLEDGAYNRLMDQYYQTERPLSLDMKMVYRLARANTAVERKAVDFVVTTFFEKTEGGYTQKRIASEISRYQDKQRKAQASANARWNKSEKDATADANASITHDESDDASTMRTHSDGNAHQTPDTRHHRKHSSPSSGDPMPIGFARFWQTWPASDRKTAKAKCLELWRKRKLEPLTDQIVQHVESLKSTKQWREGFEPAPLTYLNQRRWEDGEPGQQSGSDDMWAGAL